MIALLQYGAAQFPERTAIKHGTNSITYGELYTNTLQWAGKLHSYCGRQTALKVAVACANPVSFMQATFAANYLGYDVVLVNPGTPLVQLLELLTKHSIEVLITDSLQLSLDGVKVIAFSTIERAQQGNTGFESNKKRAAITILTGGTTGGQKAATRNAGIMQYLQPFKAIVRNCNINNHKSIYISLPLFHGFGLASLLMAVTLGMEISLTSQFDITETLDVIKSGGADVWVGVPTVFQRCIEQIPSNANIKCIITGGAPLPGTLATKLLERFGQVVYNLYGSSEAGFCMMATPAMLALHPETIGKPLPGVRATLSPTGTLIIQSKWGMLHSRNIDTGDICHIDENGFYYLKGRADDMIVSGGENAYATDVEHALLHLPHVAEAAVVSIADDDFHARFRAFVVLDIGQSSNESMLLDGLRSTLSRHQMPVSITICDALPLTAIGKIDKKALVETSTLQPTAINL